MARQILNEEEMAFLATIEPKLKTATEARWVSHLPDSAIDRMLEIWKDLTGTERNFKRGCGTCILHLCIDLGTLYFQQKPEKTQKTPKSAPNASKGSKGQAKGKTPKSAKNNK